MSHPVPLIQKIEQQFRRGEPLPEFRPGDTIRVQVKIREGEKERLQAFEGVCIRRARGGSRSSFTVRKISYGVGVERVFAENSPNIAGVDVLTHGKVRQARLYFLRNLSGKAARLKERAYQPREEDREKSKGKKRGSHRKAAARAETPAEAVPEVRSKKRQARKQAKAKAKAAKSGPGGAAAAATTE